jgi:phosphoglycolate phosphatase
MKKKNIEAIIFDLDGTLLNSLEDIADSANEAIKRFGADPHAVEAYRYFVGDGLAMLMKRAMPDNSSSTVLQESVECFQSIYNERWYKKTKPYDGIMVMLERFQQTGVKMAILSNKPDTFTQKCVNLFFPRIKFSAVAGKKEDTPPKPDPYSTLKIIDALAVHPEQSLFVGDSSIDIKTGIGAGMLTVGVDWGFRTKNELEEAGAHSIISSPQELIHYVSKR